MLLLAIKELQIFKVSCFCYRWNAKKQHGEVINVFYAGFGPYAPFVTLVAPFFKSNEVQFTLLEINKNSVESAKKLINALELSDYIKEVNKQ